MLNSFFNNCLNTPLESISQQLVDNSVAAYSVNNGNIPKWQKVIDEIDLYQTSELEYTEPYLNIKLDIDNTANLEQSLKQLIPWRKGPFKIGNLKIDSEWRGDIKWDRFSKYMQPLENRTVLDVGSGNGYFTIRMALSGAKLAIGIDPFLLFNYQFQAIRSLINNPPSAFVLPLRLEQLPDLNSFDSVFSMGVLYHQKDHMQHLFKLKKMLNDDGELILETLIIEGDGPDIVPTDRYARMRNVWRIPSVKTLYSWIDIAGFSSIECVDINQTMTNEQRSTGWIGENAKSLKDFIDPINPNLTIEGYPAPKRAIFICRN